MTARDFFRGIMAERRPYRNDPSRAIEWAYLTRAARKLAWMYRGVPSSEWTE